MRNPLTRRELMRRGVLAATGAAAGGLVARLPGALAAESCGSCIAPSMRVGLVTYQVGANMDLDTLIDVCEKSGMEGVELRSTHKHGVEPTLDAAARAKVKARFARTKVLCYMLGSACEYHASDPAVVRKHIDQTKAFVDLAADLGAWGVKVRPNGLRKDVPEDDTLRQIAKAVRECAEYAQSKGVAISVEVHGGGTSHPPRMAKIMQYCDHPSANLTWNCNPGDIQNGSVREYFTICQPWIQHLHIHTLTEAGYPWEELFGLLKAMKFSRFTMIETSTKSEPVEFLRAQRAAWEQLVR